MPFGTLPSKVGVLKTNRFTTNRESSLFRFVEAAVLSSEPKYLAASIGAMSCAAVFPIVLFAVFLVTIALAESFGRNTNPVAGIMFLRISMTRAYPVLLLVTFVFGLPIIWAMRECALRPGRIIGVGATVSFVIAAVTIWSVGLPSISFRLAAIETCILAVPLLLCFCLFAGWVRLMTGSSKTAPQL